MNTSEKSQKNESAERNQEEVVKKKAKRNTKVSKNNKST